MFAVAQVTLFWLLAAAMLGVALWFVLHPLLRRGARARAPGAREMNLAVHRDRLARLETALANEEIDQANYEQARSELARELLDDLPSAPSATPADAGSPRLARWSALTAALSLPVLVVGLYLHLGTPATVGGEGTRADAGESETALPSVQEMVARLEARLARDGRDGEGWSMLARSYAVMERYPDAVAAFARAYELLGDRADLLVDYAEAEMLAGGARAGASSSALVARALAIEPRHQKGLWIAGFAAHQDGRPEVALSRWRELAALLPDDSRERGIVDRLIAEVTAQSGATTARPGTAAEREGGQSIGVPVRVSLAAGLTGETKPSDTVFVFARAVDGPPMPVALARLTVSDLPADLVLDDTMSMLPGAKLSDQRQVVVGARVSRSGNAMPQPGDLQGMSELVEVGSKTAAVEIVISHQIE